MNKALRCNLQNFCCCNYIFACQEIWPETLTYPNQKFYCASCSLIMSVTSIISSLMCSHFDSQFYTQWAHTDFLQRSSFTGSGSPKLVIYSSHAVKAICLISAGPLSWPGLEKGKRDNNKRVQITKTQLNLFKSLSCFACEVNSQIYTFIRDLIFLDI